MENGLAKPEMSEQDDHPHGEQLSGERAIRVHPTAGTSRPALPLGNNGGWRVSPPRPGSLRARPIAAATLAGGLVIALALAGTLDGLERSEYDLLFRLRGARAPVAPVVVAAIDEASFEALGRWPFPRAVHARAIDRLREAGAAVIGIDVLFSEPSGPGDDDQRLGEAVARAGNVVLAAAVTRVAEARHTKLDLNPPIEEIRGGADAFAPANVVVDDDGVLRRALLNVDYAGRALPHFVVEVYHLDIVRPYPVVDEIYQKPRDARDIHPEHPGMHLDACGDAEYRNVLLYYIEDVARRAVAAAKENEI